MLRNSRSRMPLPILTVTLCCVMFATTLALFQGDKAYITSLQYNHSGSALAVGFGDFDDPCGNLLSNPEDIGVFVWTLQPDTVEKIIDDCTPIDLAFDSNNQVLYSASLIGRLITFDLVDHEVKSIYDLSGRPYIATDWYNDVLIAVDVSGADIVNNITNSSKILGPPHFIASAALNWQGTSIITAGEDNSAIVWLTADLSSQSTYNEHSNIIRSIAWRPDGNETATGDENGELRLWSPASAQTNQILLGHTGAIRRLAWSSDGTRLASASEDGTVKVWNTDTGALLETLTYPGPVYALDWSPDGEQIAYGGADSSGNTPEVVIIDAPEIEPTPTMTPTVNASGSSVLRESHAGRVSEKRRK